MKEFILVLFVGFNSCNWIVLMRGGEMTVRTKIIIAKCIVFPVYFITMPVSFIVGGIRGIKESWKLFIELDKEELRSEVEK